MTSTATAASAGLPHQHPHPHDRPSPLDYALPASLIATRPILPLPKRRIPSGTSSTNPNPSTPSTSTSSSTAIRGTTSPNQIFSHTYPLPASSSSSPKGNRSLLPPYLPLDTRDSESDDDGEDAGSTDSSFGREDFNSSNKKKRKIPLSVTSNATLNNVIVDGNGGASPGPGTRVLSSKTGLSSSAGSGGRYAGWRVPSATMRSEGGYFRRTKARRSVEPEESMNGVVPGIARGMPSTPERSAAVAAGEEERTSPAPSGPFSFSCPSPLSVPLASMIPPSVKSSSASTSTIGEVYAGQPSAPPTAPLPAPPPPPAATIPGQENIPTQQAYTQTSQVSAQTQTTPHPQAPAQQPGQPAQQPQQQQQPQSRTPTQGIKHPNSEKARRVAQLTKLRERWRTGPKPEPDEIYICPFCTYGFIYGEDPIYLVRQYNRKRCAEIRARRERRKMLEKARMKGKKGAATQPTATQGTNPAQQNAAGQVATNNSAQQSEEVDGQGDGLCCTCGQKVEDHSHVVDSAQAKAAPRGDPGPGPGGKVRV